MEPVWLGSPAPWAGHIPFAAWLVASMRPSTLVELGVYSGISYLSFCQAAVQNGVPMKAWGVDTWEGDAHAGHYGNSVWDTLRAQHDGRFSAHSTLLRMRFDEAVSEFADGAVDLLHIDGLHTYDAVRHDFETWRSKLSARGVVLFHDTEVRRDDFGVWRLWAELKDAYPSISFTHSNGLGVLLVGPDAPQALLALCQDERRAATANTYFSALGERFERRAEAMNFQAQETELRAAVAHDQAIQLEQHQWITTQDEVLREAERQRARDAEALAQFRGEAEHQRARADALQARLQSELLEAQTAFQREMAVLQATLDQSAGAQAQLQRQLAQSDVEWSQSLRDSNERLSNEQRDWQQRMGQVTRQARQFAQELQVTRNERNVLAAQVDEFLASRSWKATAGLRSVGRLARRVRNTPQGTAAAVTLRRARNALRYAAAGNWRELLQRVQHVKQQAAEQQRLERFEGKTVCCGILCTPHTLFVAHALQSALARAGMPAEIVAEADDYPLDLYFVVCPQMFKRLPPGERRVAFQMEQTVSSRWFTPDYLAVLENSLAALDYAQTNLANLADYGIAYPHVFLLPIGGIANYAQWLGGPAQADESCEVLFYGDANAPRRKRLLKVIGQHFKLRVVGNAFGADMRRALAGAQVVVNLHYYEGALLETTRIFECLSLGKAVVSEKSVDQAEHTDLEQVVRFADIDDAQGLVAAIQDALAEQSSEAGRAQYDQRRLAVVQASQQRFDFMLFRLLLAWRMLSYPQFRALSAPGQAMAPRLALSLPETTTRRQAFELVRPDGVKVFDGLRYSPGWIGCAMGYKYMAERALEQGIPWLEIMEDDVEFRPDHEERRAVVMAYLEENANDWDVFAGLMAEVHPETQVLKVDKVGAQTFVTIDRMISAVCNIYAPKAQRLLAQWDETNQDAQTNTIDRFVQLQGGLRVVVALPFLVGHQEALDSSLWGISNVRYSQLIEDAEAKLGDLVEQWQAQGVGA